MSGTSGAHRRRIGLGAAVVLVIAAAAVTVLVGIIRGLIAPVEAIPLDDVPVTATAEAPALYVHVAGAVASPGLYRVASDARVVDAIAAAGGFADDADPVAVNLARPLSDGEQLYIPVVGETTADAGGAGEPGGAGGTVGGRGKVDLNTADAAALDALPRVGPAIAERIIAWREDNGRFTSVEDLLAVSGIGEKMLETLRDLVTV